ncbi:MAG: SCO family protein [Flavobacteriales bacterium]
MKNWMSLKQISIGLSFSFLVACGLQVTTSDSKQISLPFYISEDLTPHWISEDSSAYDNIHRISDFSFTDQDGREVTEKDIEGKIYVANFFFTTCPGVCRLMTNELLTVQEAFDAQDNVMILSHTVMPWVDTVAQLKYFEQLHELDGSMWKLLTGSKEDLYGIARTSYFADEGFGKSVTESSDFLHTENVMLIDRHRRIRGVYNGTSKLDIKRLIEDIQQLEGTRH